MNRDGARGFSLLEVLVALLVLGLVAALAAGTVREAGRAWGVAERRGAAVAETDAAAALLRRLLAAARADAAVPGEPARRFAGTAASVAFLAPLPAALAPAHAGVPGAIRLDLTRAGELRLAWRVDDPEGAMEAGGAALLLRGLTGGAFAYFGRADGAEAATWHADWRDAARLPDLGRIRLERPGVAASEWVVPPRVTGPDGCVYDPRLTACREMR